MITPKFFILLVCLLQAQRALGFNYEIDLERCKTEPPYETVSSRTYPPDAACFARDSCIEKDNGEEEGKSDVLALFTNRFLEEYDDKGRETCDIIVQIKPLTSSKWHVMMKVTGTNLTPEKGISFTQGTTQFSCKLGMNSLEGELKPKEFGGGHKFSSDSMACSIIFDTSPGKIADRFSGNTNKPTLLYYVKGQEQKVEFASTGNTFWALPKVYCNHDKIKSKDGIDGNFILHEVDTTRAEFNRDVCTVDQGSLKLRLNGSFIDIDYFRCENKEYNYDDNRGNKGVIIDPALPSFEIYCAVDVCSKCPDFVFNKNCDDCVEARMGTKGNCKTASCPSDKKWRMDDKSLVDATVECKQIGNGRTAGWFMGEQQIIGGSCSDKYDCPVFSKLNFSCNAVDCTKADLSVDNQTISCPDGFLLKIGSTIVDYLKCDPSTGLYSYGQTIKAEQGANIYCHKKKPLPAAVVELPSSAGAEVGIAIGIFLAAVLA